MIRATRAQKNATKCETQCETNLTHQENSSEEENNNKKTLINIGAKSISSNEFS